MLVLQAGCFGCFVFEALGVTALHLEPSAGVISAIFCWILAHLCLLAPQADTKAGGTIDEGELKLRLPGTTPHEEGIDIMT